MGQIFVRERSNIGKGAGTPRFEILAVAGLDLKVYHSHIRRAELDKLAETLQAELVWLPRGEESATDEHQGGGRRRRGGGGKNRSQE
jgi:hypothetical protein